MNAGKHLNNKMATVSQSSFVMGFHFSFRKMLHEVFVIKQAF